MPLTRAGPPALLALGLVLAGCSGVVETESGARTNESFTLPLAEGDRTSFLHVRIDGDGSLDGDLFWED